MVTFVSRHSTTAHHNADREGPEAKAGQQKQKRRPFDRKAGVKSLQPEENLRVLGPKRGPR